MRKPPIFFEMTDRRAALLDKYRPLMVRAMVRAKMTGPARQLWYRAVNEMNQRQLRQSIRDMEAAETTLEKEQD